MLFMTCILVPGSFFVGTARLTPYRLFLLLAILPLIWQVLRGALGRLTSVDVFIVCYVVWLAISIFVQEGIERFEFATVLTIESLCGYLFGRVMVRSCADYTQFMRVFLAGLLVLAPFAMIEMLTKQNLINQITGMFLQTYDQILHAPRLGFYRAQSSFEHPILFGLFCSLGFANAFYIYRLHKSKQLFWMGTSGFTTFASLSSAPMLALLLQSMMIAWDRLARRVRAKWLVLVGIGATVFAVLELLTPDGAVSFLVNNLTLVPETAEYRILTLQYTIGQVIEYPFFGIPEGAAELPWWHTGSIDNFWLSTAVAYGIPTTVFLFLAVALHLLKVIAAPIADEQTSDIRTGHLIAVAALIFLLTTVHLWGPASVMVMTYLGAGAWTYAPQRAPARRGATDRPIPVGPTSEQARQPASTDGRARPTLPTQSVRPIPATSLGGP